MEKITWDYIVNTAPDIIKEILGGLKSHKENPEYHPEGNAYEHIRIVTERLIQTGDMDLVMAGFFHDLGKLSTAAQSEEGDWNSSHGHENVSSQLVLRYKDWIGEMGANPYVVNEIVKNHMRIKFGAISKKDKDRLERYTIFQKLTQFMDADNMKKPWQLNEGLNLVKKRLPGEATIRQVFQLIAKNYADHVPDFSGPMKSAVHWVAIPNWYDDYTLKFWWDSSADENPNIIEVMAIKESTGDPQHDQELEISLQGLDHPLDLMQALGNADRQLKKRVIKYWEERNEDDLREGLNLIKQKQANKMPHKLNVGDIVKLHETLGRTSSGRFRVKGDPGIVINLHLERPKAINIATPTKSEYYYQVQMTDNGEILSPLPRDMFDYVRSGKINEGLNLPKKKFIDINDIQDLQKGDQIVCMNIDCFACDQYFTIGQTYSVLGVGDRLVVISGNNGIAYNADKYDLRRSFKKDPTITEGLNLPKQSGSKQFDNVTVFYKLLPQDEATRRYNVQRPIQLTYLIDGEPIPDSVSDPKFHEMLNKLEPIFKEKIQPYFERLGYTLWSY